MVPLLDGRALAKVTTGHHHNLNDRETLAQPSQLSHGQLNFRDSEAFQSRAKKNSEGNNLDTYFVEFQLIKHGKILKHKYSP